MTFHPWIRLKSSLITWPDRAGWRESIFAYTAALVAIGAVAATSGMLHWQPAFTMWPTRLLKVMLVPALAEELVFRGLLTPSRGGGQAPAIWVAASLGLFVLWHVIEALTFLPGARLFLTLPFLVCAAILGAACAIMRYRTGSLWPAVLLHTGVVFIWQTAFGGPDVAMLLKP